MSIKKVSILGLGNISYELCLDFFKNGIKVYGVTENFDRIKSLIKLGVKVYNRNEISECLSNANRLIITVPPDIKGCPIMRNYFKEITNSNVEWIGYLSSTSVYGNHEGEIVNENSECKPLNEKEISRYKGEEDIQNFSMKYSIPAEIFRVSGIYGSSRNIIKQILANKISPLYKKNHVFNRIHEKDIARVLCQATLSIQNAGIVNLSDNLPASQLEVINYGAKIMKASIPKFKSYEDVHISISEGSQRFWENNRRVNNDLLKKRYGELIFPSYKEGLDYIYKDYLLTSLNKD